MATGKTLFRIIFFTLVFIVASLTPTVTGQANSYRFAQRDTSSLWLDVYQPQTENKKDICVIYIFGGGFVQGSKTQKDNVSFFNYLAEKGYTVAAIDYRLGLKGVRKVGPFHPKPAFKAVRMATEDLLSATSYIIKHHDALGIDPKRIVLIGSSAGAITALQADYELCNRSEPAKVLPENFRYAAVVSLAGAIFSTKGTPRYAAPPAPTLFMHGTKDKIVVYNKIKIFKLGMFGTKAMVKIFEKKDYPFMAIRFEGLKHEVASFNRRGIELFPEYYATDLMCDFIDKSVAGGYTNETDILIRDKEISEKYNHW